MIPLYCQRLIAVNPTAAKFFYYKARTNQKQQRQTDELNGR